MMNKFVEFINVHLAPKLTKISKNAWLNAVQESLMTILPFIFVGSVINVVNNLRVVWESMPDLSPISSYTFGILGILLAYMFPYNLLKNKKIHKFATLGGFTGVGMYLMMSGLSTNAPTAIASYFGAGGMFVAIILGIFISLVMMFFNKYSLFKNNDTLPEIVVTWFDSLIPISLCFIAGWWISYPLGFNIFGVVNDLFAPLFSSSNTIWALVGINFAFCFVYSFGISGWAIAPIAFPILLANTAANVAAGQNAVLITSFEVILCAWLAIGGMGNTLSLNILMLFSKAKRIKAIGKAGLVPSIFNVNEPIAYGLPIALNPIMMIPLWINGIVPSVITYFVLTSGLVPIPHNAFTMQFLPSPIETFIITNGSFTGPLFALVMFFISGVIYYPFFKSYEKTVIQEEKELLEGSNV